MGHSLGSTVVIRMLSAPELQYCYGPEEQRVARAVVFAPCDQAVNAVPPSLLKLLRLKGGMVTLGNLLGLFDAKGTIEELLSGIPAVQWLPISDAAAGQAPSDSLFHPRASLRLRHAKGVLGTVGMLHPVVARAWDLEREEACLFQIDLDLLAQLETAKAQFAPFSVFPQSSRDLSFLVDSATRYDDVLGAVRSVGVTELRDVELVDKFTGQGVPPGKQSLTMRLRFGLADRTLKDSEVAAAVERILFGLQSKYGAILRS